MMLPRRALPALLCLLPALCGPLLGAPEKAEGPIALQDVDFGQIRWGRNSVLVRGSNSSSAAVTLAVRIRSHFTNSGSGVWWEATFPALLPPGESGNLSFDYVVRPDHGTLRVELQVEDAQSRILLNENREVEFSPPYREEYTLQAYRFTGEGLAWESRIFPPFQVGESEHFFYYYFPGSEAEYDIERIQHKREKLLRDLSRRLGLEPPGKGFLFLYPDAEISRSFTGHRGDGWAYGRTIVEVYGAKRKIDPRHELAHFLTSTLGLPPVLFSEGLATYFEKSFDNAGKFRAPVSDWCEAFAQKSVLIPLEELMAETSLGEDITRPRIAYPQSACFVQYLIDSYGWERFSKAYGDLRIGKGQAVLLSNLEVFEAVFGKSLEETEKEWLSSLRQGGKKAKIPMAVLEEVIEGEMVPYLVAKGRDRLQAGNLDEAFPPLLAAVEMDEADLPARFWLAQAHHLGRNLEAALGEYQRVIELGDRYSVTEVAWSRVWSGQILDMLGRREEALVQYRKGEALEDKKPVQIGGRLISSWEAARRGLERPFQESKP